MTALTPNAEDGPSAAASAGTPQAQAPALQVGSPHHCAGCGAELALDQRYCVECGTRRGRPRFVIAGRDAAQTAPSPPAPAPAAGARLFALLAVVAVLLALGIGVLIGSSGTSIRQPLKVTITGGSVPSGSSKTGAAGTAKSGGSKSGGSSTQSQNFFGG